MKRPDTHSLSALDFNFSKLFPAPVHLTNGLPVYLFPGGAQELVRLEFIFEAGSFYQDRNFLAQTCLHLLGEGSENFSAAEISEKFDYYGAFIEKYADKDQASFVVYALSQYLEPIIELCEDIIFRPTFPEKEMRLYLDKQKQKFRVELQKVGEISRREFYRMIYGSEHPYGKILEEIDFDNIHPEDLKNFHKRCYGTHRCKIVLAGSYSDKHWECLSRSFGRKFDLGEKLLNPKEILWIAPNEKKRFVKKEDAVQNSVRMGKPIMSPSDPNFVTFRMLNYIFGGYFGSRLMRNIREEKGYTYGISSYFVPFRYASTWIISSEVKSEMAQKVIEEIYIEMDKLCQNPVSKDELELVKNSYYGEMLRDMDGIFEMAEKMKFHLLFDLKENYYTSCLEDLQNLKPEEIQTAAQTYFVKDSIFELNAGV